jgi:hypothetical protein
MELFDQERRGWNITLLREIFNMEDQVAIQLVPISCTSQPDQLVLRGTLKGVFSVSRKMAPNLKVQVDADTMCYGKEFGR